MSEAFLRSAARFLAVAFIIVLVLALFRLAWLDASTRTLQRMEKHGVPPPSPAARSGNH